MSFIDVINLTKQYNSNDVQTMALDHVSFSLDEGDFCVVLGQSGAGKSTLLNMLGGMDSPTSGSITVDGTDISDMRERALTQYRRNSIGFVFQFYNIIPNLTIPRIQLVSATAGFGSACFDCSLAISSSHTSLGVLYPRSFMGVSLISPTIASSSSCVRSSKLVPLGR